MALCGGKCTRAGFFLVGATPTRWTGQMKKRISENKPKKAVRGGNGAKKKKKKRKIKKNKVACLFPNPKPTKRSKRDHGSEKSPLNPKKIARPVLSSAVPRGNGRPGGVGAGAGRPTLPERFFPQVAASAVVACVCVPNGTRHSVPSRRATPRARLVKTWLVCFDAALQFQHNDRVSD